MPLGGFPQIFDLDAYQTSSVQQHNLGAMGVDKYGDLFRYAKVGASNITAGKLQSSPARKTNHDNVAAVSASAAGAKSVTVTLGATAATANEYAGGLLVASDESPEGESYRIVSNPAADSSATLKLTLERPLITAVTTSSEFCLVHNSWNAVIEQAVEEAAYAGFPQVDMTAAYFGWLKTRGVSAALAGNTIDLGATVTSDASTAGAVLALSDTDETAVDSVPLGEAIVAGVNGEYRPILVLID
jgi:hypothetical protein